LLLTDSKTAITIFHYLFMHYQTNKQFFNRDPLFKCINLRLKTIHGSEIIALFLWNVQNVPKTRLVRPCLIKSNTNFGIFIIKFLRENTWYYIHTLYRNLSVLKSIITLVEINFGIKKIGSYFSNRSLRKRILATLVPDNISSIDNSKI
jgi:hypothetical protein